MKAIVLAMFCAILSLAKERDTLIISFGNDWPPYFSKSADGSFRGLEIDLLQAIFRDAEIPVKMISLPTPRGHEYLKNGEIDFLCAASFTDSRNEYARFSVPYRDESVALMVRKKDLSRYRFTKLADIRNYPGVTIAHERGGWYGKEFETISSNGLFTPFFVETWGVESRLKMLITGRVTMVIDDYYSLADAARVQGVSSQLAFHPFKPSIEPIHCMFSRVAVSETTVMKVNRSIKKLSNNGTLRKI